MTERRTRIQGIRREGTEGTISWAEHELIHAAYKTKWHFAGSQQDAERIAERGGFGYAEAVELLGRDLQSFIPATA